MRALCSSRKPMRKTPLSGFPRALLSLSHARKRRALASRLGIKCTALDQSKLNNFVESNINEQRKDFRQENPNVES